MAAATVLIVAACTTATERSASAPTAQSRWAWVATRACQRMQDEISSRGSAYWESLNVNRPGRITALLRRDLLGIHTRGLRFLRSHAPSPTRAEAHALALYERMLVSIRRVVAAASRGNARAYYAADIRMRLLIQQTREAFDHEGVDHICSFAI